MATSKNPSPARRGRPAGTRLLLTDEQVARFTAHLSVSSVRHPLLTAWLAQREQGRLAGDLVDFMERALAGMNVGIELEGTAPEVHIDLSGLMDWD